MEHVSIHRLFERLGASPFADLMDPSLSILDGRWPDDARDLGGTA
jgi:hypothetical protein